MTRAMTNAPVIAPMLVSAPVAKKAIAGPTPRPALDERSHRRQVGLGGDADRYSQGGRDRVGRLPAEHAGEQSRRQQLDDQVHEGAVARK